MKDKKQQVHISAEVHTVFILAGPSRCGKTTLAHNLASELDTQYRKLVDKPEDANFTAVSVLSSDAYRHALTGAMVINPEFCTVEMQEMSEQAFQMLFAELKASTSFPVNMPFVIVDTTGLDAKFRNDVINIAKNANYKVQIVLFDLPHSEYYSAIPEGYEHQYRQTIAFQAKRFKSEVMPVIRTKDFDAVYRLRHRENQTLNGEGGFTVQVTAAGMTRLPIYEMAGDDTYAIIGDVHEHVKALSEMISIMDSAYTHDNLRFILIGDYLDKGGFTKETIDIVWTLVNARGAIVVKANHENYVVKRLLNQVDPNPEIEEAHFSSLKFLLENKEYADKVIEIWARSVPYVKLIRPNASTVYVTHAPCRNNVLGKISDYAQREQRNLRRYKQEDAREHYSFLFEEARGNHPIHVMGHVAHCAERLGFKNKVLLDTGAVYGGKLSAMVVTVDRERIAHVNCEQLFAYEDKNLRADAVTPVKVQKPFSISDYSLSDDDMKALRRMTRSPIKYISGTMAPSQSTKTEIEPLSTALEYFKANGVEQVILEPKYMGSRGQLYMYRNEPEKSFAVSRNGFIVRREGIKELVEAQHKYFAERFAEQWKDELIVDGELMPWAFLGKGLIEHEFETYGQLILNELSDLDSDDELAKLNLHKTLKLSERQEHLNVFFQQLALYGGECESHFKPFQVLSIDGQEMVTTMSAEDNYTSVSTDEYLVVNTTDGLEKAQEFFNRKTTAEGMEGVVLKPMNHTEGVAPYMKVRNEGYLHLIYGYDYKMRYEKLCLQKRTGGKLKTAIREHDLALALLKDNGDNRTELITKMIFELGKEKELDPRL